MRLVQREVGHARQRPMRPRDRCAPAERHGVGGPGATAYGVRGLARPDRRRDHRQGVLPPDGHCHCRGDARAWRALVGQSMAPTADVLPRRPGLPDAIPGADAVLAPMRDPGPLHRVATAQAE